MKARFLFLARYFLRAVLASALATTTQAQIVADGGSSTLNNVTSNITGTVTVGTNGSFTLLVLTNAALLTNSGNGVIGRSVGANSNAVRLTSANTRWLMSLDHFVGSNGAFNRLIVSNSARVENNFGSLGIGATSSNNEATVTGSGSLWSNRNDLYVGYVGSANRLLVTNGGVVSDNSGILGIDAASGGNEAVVTGSGSVWTNRASAFVGFSGSVNRLTVTNNGTLLASNNVIVGNASGSVSNLLWLVAGGVVTNGRSGVVGLNAGANGNLALLSGSSSRWVSGDDFLVGSNGSFNQLVVSNGAMLINADGELGQAPGSSNNLAWITGAGSLWTNRGILTVGFYGPGNTLVVSNGATLANLSAALASKTASSSNLIWVTGSGSLWDTANSCTVGSEGPANTLVVSNGATVICGGSSACVVGTFISSSNNVIWVTGSGSVWTNRQSLNLGQSGGANLLVISNNAAVFIGGSATVGEFSSSTNNHLIVEGANLFGTNAGQGILDVRRGRLDFNGGAIAANFLFVTNNGSAFTNSIFDFNQGTLTTTLGSTIKQTGSSADFAIGAISNATATWIMSGGTNILDLGGGVSGGDTIIGSTVGSHGAVAVMGASTVWSNTGDLYVGHSGPSCSLVVSNGAKVISSLGELGLFASSSNNQAWVTGPGSVWTNRVSVLVGLNGSGNLLVVSNGGAVFSGDGVLGGNASSTNNLVQVTGIGSVWTAFEDFGVGANGSGNLLVITNRGAVVASASFVLGSASTATNNRAIVDGGTLRVTNAANSGVLDVRRGTNVLNAGFIEVDRLLVTNTLGVFEFNGGVLKTENTTNNNGHTFFVGNGTDEASLELVGNGVHVFANGLTIRSNTTLGDNGAIIGPLTVLNGGVITPGGSVGNLGKLMLNTSPTLQGRTFVEISKNGSTLTNDQIQVTALLSYGGTLFVNKIGPTALNAGDQFPLFSASSYSGSFSSITLPALGAGLTWTNKLLVDGSIQVLSSVVPKFDNVTLSGTNVVFSGTGGPANATYWVLASTNVALPLTNWTRLLINQFNASGNFTFTNAISPAVPQRYYLVQVP